MGSYLFSVEVKEIDKLEILLKLTIIHPDQTSFYQRKNFLLQLLWDPGTGFFENRHPLFQDISKEKIYDSNWVVQNAPLYIADYEILYTEFYPWDHDLEQNPIALYVVKVCCSEVIYHLKTGVFWKTAAYNMENDVS